MKLIVAASLSAAALAVACSSTPDAPSTPTDPVDAAADAPSCACPDSCESTSQAGWRVCNPQPAPTSVPASQKIGKYQIGNFEYWPYKHASPYPTHTICGFNGEQECGWNGAAKGPPPDAARACMAEARAVLVDILTNAVPAELDALRTKHGVFKFWNWNNDLTDAPAGRVPTSRELWLYDGTRGDGGLIKWISETERDGTCHLPTRDDLVTFAKACIDDFPNCGSGK
jgi:hypothetical protein